MEPPCVREYENDRHCNSHFFGEHYQDMDAALAACAANSGCSGVYDNRCDGQTIQYDSRTTGFVMCDSDYDFEASSQGSCIVTCEAPAAAADYAQCMQWFGSTEYGGGYDHCCFRLDDNGLTCPTWESRCEALALARAPAPRS